MNCYRPREARETDARTDGHGAVGQASDAEGGWRREDGGGRDNSFRTRCDLRANQAKQVPHLIIYIVTFHFQHSDEKTITLEVQRQVILLKGDTYNAREKKILRIPELPSAPLNTPVTEATRDLISRAVTIA